MIKILFLAANPVDTAQFQLAEESRAIDQALRMVAFRNRFDIRSHWAVHYAELPELLMRYKPDIVHFSGHGSAAGEIILDENKGGGHPVSAQALSRLFAILKGKIRCVVLNACFSQIQAEAIAESIDCVVGMSKAISNAAAIDFAAAFYQGLGSGHSVQTAFNLACNRIDWANLAEQDTPQLLARRVNPQAVVLVETARTDEPRTATASEPTHITIGDAAYIGGNVNTGGGDFTGRDKKVMYGDEVQGNKVEEHIGDVAARGSILYKEGGVLIAGPAHIQGDVVGRDKVEISGDVSIAGRDLFQGQRANREGFLVELHKLRDEVAQMAQQQLIDEEAAILARAQVAAAISNAQKSRPEPDKIAQRLTQAKEIIEETVSGAGAAAGLVTALIKAIAMVHQVVFS